MAFSRKRLLIVDGYNVLRSGGRYQSITQPDYTDDSFNVARERLVNDVIDYAGRDMKAIIVYDGAGNPYSRPTEQEKIGNVSIMFSQPGQSADRLIEKLAYEGRERHEEVLVVTSDASIQETVFGGGVTRMSAQGFCQELASNFDGARQEISPDPASKRTIQDRLSPDVVQKLKEMRDRSSNTRHS